jgi:hypothetical protein
VVNLLVRAYNLVRDGSRAILSRAGPTHSPATQARWLQPGGHDFSWVLGPPLAADRVWPPNHRQYLAPHLPRVQVPYGAARSGPQRRNVSESLKRDLRAVACRCGSKSFETLNGDKNRKYIRGRRSTVSRKRNSPNRVLSAMQNESPTKGRSCGSGHRSGNSRRAGAYKVWMLSGSLDY